MVLPAPPTTTDYRLPVFAFRPLTCRWLLPMIFLVALSVTAWEAHSRNVPDTVPFPGACGLPQRDIVLVFLLVAQAGLHDNATQRTSLGEPEIKWRET
jgi:hypothetical protein